MTNEVDMSLERTYKNCENCWKMMNKANTPEKTRTDLMTFTGLYMRNEAMKALEEENKKYKVAEEALEQCKSCNYTTPGIKNFIDESAKKE